MEFSLVNNQRLAPFPKGKGYCDMCGAETIAKCGEKVIWHWAHKGRKSCDPWWENETEWHRSWKSHFPENSREVVFECDVTGEKHRADVISDTGIVVEIQNSPISLEELRSRENFYKNMAWVVNGQRFKSRFEIFEAMLPNPDAHEFDDIVFQVSEYPSSGTMFWRKSENAAFLNGESMLVQIHSTRKIQQEINEHYRGHHPFFWKRRHVAWLNAKCPVYIDFGEDILWRLESYKNQFICVRAICKRKFIHDVMIETEANNIATRFYPIKNNTQKQGAI